MKLIDSFAGPKGNKFLVVAQYAEVKLETEEFDHNKIGKKDINKKTPLLETPEGVTDESNQILSYIARLSKKAQLYGINKWEEIQIDKFLNWTLNVVEPALFGFTDILWGHFIPNDEGFAMTSAKFFSVVGIFEGILKKKRSKYLIGDQISIADINIVSDLIFVLRFVGDQDFRDRFPKVVEYVEALARESQFTDIFGKVIQCKTVALPLVRSSHYQFEESKEVFSHHREETKTREVDTPTKKDLIYSFPTTPFNLNEFKTLFVNIFTPPEQKKALNNFWAALDKNHTVWRMEYEMAEGEGSVVFQTKNMLTGYLHRLDSLKKNAFAVVGVYGNQPYLEIRGCWIWKDQGIPRAIQDHPSSEWWRFKQLDVKKNPADRKIFEEYWTSWKVNRDKVEDLTVRNVQYFK